MADETEVFRLEIDVTSSEGSRKKSRERDEGRHGGRQGASGQRGSPSAAATAAGASTGAGARATFINPAVVPPGASGRPGGPNPAKQPASVKPSASQERASLKKRFSDIQKKAPKLDRNFFTNMASGTARAIPFVGGALALGFFQVMNAERLAALDEITGNTTNLGATIKAAREIKPRFEATAKTIGNIVEIGNAFGSIGDTPPAAAFGELIPLLQRVNHAQALQQFDLKEAMFRSAGSTVRKTLQKTNKAELVGDMIGALSEGMRK